MMQEAAARLVLLHKLAIDINRHRANNYPPRPNLIARANALGYSRSLTRSGVLRDLVKLVREDFGPKWEPTGAVRRALDRYPIKQHHSDR